MKKLGLREFHRFEAAGTTFLYLVPSAAVLALDHAASAVLEALGRGPMTPQQLINELSGRFSPADLKDTISELIGVRAIGDLEASESSSPRTLPPMPFP